MPTAKRSSAKKVVKPRVPVPDRVPVRRGPVWEGPDGAGPNGGVTYSLLCRFLTCPERFRLLIVDGLRPAERFVAPIEFGNMWHACEEQFAKGKDLRTGRNWNDALNEYVQTLFRKFPLQRPEVADWYDKCRALFPVYVEYWSTHDDVKNRTPLLSERAFDVPYRLPSGRTVRLRGKWDSVDLVTPECDGCGRMGKYHEPSCPASAGGVVWLQENKTKSGIDRSAVTRQMAFDLQTMIYVVALQTWQDEDGYGDPVRFPQAVDSPIKGVRYNVVRRSAHKGGRGVSAAESMLKKYREDAAEGREGEWFARWNVEVSPADVARFRARCLDPLLERLCGWWNWVTSPYGMKDPFGNPLQGCVPGDPPDALPGVHYQHPFGVRNILDEGGATDLDECILTGSTVGLNRTTNLFPELT